MHQDAFVLLTFGSLLLKMNALMSLPVTLYYKARDGSEPAPNTVFVMYIIMKLVIGRVYPVFGLAWFLSAIPLCQQRIGDCIS